MLRAECWIEASTLLIVADTRPCTVVKYDSGAMLKHLFRKSTCGVMFGHCRWTMHTRPDLQNRVIRPGGCLTVTLAGVRIHWLVTTVHCKHLLTYACDEQAWLSIVARDAERSAAYLADGFLPREKSEWRVSCSGVPGPTWPAVIVSVSRFPLLCYGDQLAAIIYSLARGPSRTGRKVACIGWKMKPRILFGWKSPIYGLEPSG